MPENWKTYKLGEISRIGDGAHTKVKRVDEGILYLTSKNFKKGQLILDKIDYISETDYNRLFSSNSKAVNKPEVGDIILGIIGTLGNAYLYKESDIFGISSSVAIIRADKSKIFPKFLYYYITGNKFKHYQNAHNGASVQGYTNIPSLKSIPIFFPSLNEQIVISSILSALDDKIELNLQMNKTLEEMAMALYKHWFVDFGPFQDVEFVESELGMIPKGWEVKTLGDEFDITIGRTPPRKESKWFSFTSGVKWISIKDMGNAGTYIFNTAEYLTDDAVKAIPKVPENTVILSFKLTVGRVSITTENMVTNEAIAHFIKNKRTSISSEYLYLALKIFDYNSLGSTSSIATAVNSKTVKGIKMVIPSHIIVDSFQEKVEYLFQNIRSNTNETQTLTTLRDTLLPKLISGEVRVKDAEKTLSAAL